MLSLAQDDPYVAALANEHTIETKLEQAQREKDLDHRLHIARNAFAMGDYDEARHALSRHIADTRNNPKRRNDRGKSRTPGSFSSLRGWQ